VTEIDDIQRNVLSILRRVAPNARIPASQLKVFVLQGGNVKNVEAIIDDEETGTDDDAARSGAFITY
jgi:hypothetical protein